MTDTEADEAPDDTSARMLDPAAFTPKEEARKTFTGDAHGLAEAADELRPVRLPFMLTGQKVLVSEHDVRQWRSAVSDRCK